MNRQLRYLWALLSSRALAPVVIGVFLLLYIGIAFSTEDALITLIGFIGSNFLLIALFALIPLNMTLRLVEEVQRHFLRRRALQGGEESILPGLFDETVEVAATSNFQELERRLAASGYKTMPGENKLSAWRGITLFPARALFFLAMVCLFSGILISLSSRTSYRGTVVEGEPFPTSAGPSGMVERITLENAAGPFLGKTLTMEVAPTNKGEGMNTFRLYPPSRYKGAFVYPRYLGIGLYFRFLAPDVPAGYESHSVLSIYPSGKEDSKEIPGSNYRLVFSMAQPADGSDPYMTGAMAIQFKLLKGKDLLFTGSVPSGGEYVKDGYRLSFPDIRRLVITDLISDNGVILVWTASIFICLAVCTWLPLRILCPCRQMSFVYDEAGAVQASSYAEGRLRSHGEVFHEALDTMGGGRQPVS